MRVFKSIGSGKCLICGTSKKGKCTLAPIDGTSDGSIEECVPIHLDCIGNLRWNEEFKLLYLRRVKNEEKA